ncbi:ATP synthase F1 subunit gamma [Candidatus Saccharibacteria bacterium]|nr:ATP synthase F1 subunit gamma [Candidatus Saccharibacteria bacterium]
MANTQALKRRIGSVKNTKQITKAMELVAASKMRKAQQAALKTRAYRNTAREILARLQSLNKASKSPYFDTRPINTKLYIVISSDRGLAGAYNSNILRLFSKKLTEDQENNIESKAIVIGKTASNFAAKLDSLDLVGVYTDFKDDPTQQDIQPILSSAQEMFTSKQVDEVVTIYTDYKSSISQIASTQQLLPAAIRDSETHEIIEETTKYVTDINDVKFEPSPEVVLERIVPKLIEAQLMQSVLEAIASEHSMRMMAMKSASDNASDLIDDLTLAFNSARQAAITQELAEITGGAAAVS